MQRPAVQRFSDPLILLLLGAVCYILFFHGLSTMGLVGPDEPRYASVAREMYQSGDFITPRLHGVPWFEKPVLMYWGAALSFAVFGVGEFAARLPSAVGATVCVFFVYFVSLRLWGRLAAVWASLVLASSVGYFAFARAASMDMPLTVCLTMALLSFLMANKVTDPGRRWWFCAFYAFVGLGVLAKGPVALVLPAISLVGYLWSRTRLDEWKQWHPWCAWIVLAVASPWYIAATWVNGVDFLKVFFLNQNFLRFTSTVHGHERPFYFYILDLILLMFPWTFLLVPALRRSLERNERILLWWAVVPIVFFSFSGSKLPGYILPSVPPLAMLCARELGNPSSRLFKIGVFIEAGLMVFIGVAFGFFGHMLDVDPHVNGLLITGITFGLALVLAAIALWLRPIVLGAFNLAAIVFALLVAVTFILPRFETTDTMRPWRSALKEIVPDDHAVYLYRPSRWMEYGMQFYRLSKVHGVFYPEDMPEVVKDGARRFFIVDDRALLALGEMPGIEVEIVQTVGNQSALWVWKSPQEQP